MDRRRSPSTRVALAIVGVAGALGLAILVASGSTDPGPRSTSGGPSAGPVVRPVADPIPWQDVAWARLEPSGLRSEPGQAVRAIERIAGGLLAHGRIRDPRPIENPDGLHDVAAVWTSRDGQTWEAHPIVDGVRPDSVSEVAAVTAGPLGVVAVGGICCREERSAIWWSRDGATWQRAPIDGAAASMLDVAAGPEGFVAIAVGDREPQIWTSTDGLAWELVDGAIAGLRPGSLASVVAYRDGFVVAGTDDPGVEDADAGVWASEGLVDWHRLAGDDPALAGEDEASLQALVEFAGGWFAVGGTGTREDRLQCENLLDGAAMAVISDTVAVARTDTALSCGWLRDMNWRAGAGPEGPWERVDPWGADGEFPPDFVEPGLAPVSWDKVVAGGPGLVALQEETVRGWPDQTSWGVYASPDGREWSRIGDGPDPAGEWFVGFAIDGRQLFAMTESGAAWLGTAVP